MNEDDIIYGLGESNRGINKNIGMHRYGGIYVYLPERMKFVKFLPDGTISEEILEKGVHYVEIALNEVPLFIRKGKCISVAEVAESVEQIDMSTLTMLGFDGAEYLLYDDDGVHKDYENEGTCRKIGK